MRHGPASLGFKQNSALTCHFSLPPGISSGMVEIPDEAASPSKLMTLVTLTGSSSAANSTITCLTHSHFRLWEGLTASVSNRTADAISVDGNASGLVRDDAVNVTASRTVQSVEIFNASAGLARVAGHDDLSLDVILILVSARWFHGVSIT